MALSLGAFVFATAGDAVTHNEKAASADTLACASGIAGYGLDVVGALWSDGASVGLEAWLAMGGSTVGLSAAALNHSCASEEYYNHLGSRVLCYVDYFWFWADNGDAVFHPGFQACINDPYTDDFVLCAYIHPYGYENACAQQEIYDAARAAIGAILW